MANIGMKGMIPLGQAGNEEYDKSVRDKLKGSSSQKRKISAKIRSIKDMNQDKIDSGVYELITNPEISASQIQKLLQQALKRELSDTNFINLIKVVIDKHKALFGNKLQLDVTQTTADIVMDRIREAKKQGI